MNKSLLVIKLSISIGDSTDVEGFLAEEARQEWTNGELLRQESLECAHRLTLQQMLAQCAAHSEARVKGLLRVFGAPVATAAAAETELAASGGGGGGGGDAKGQAAAENVQGEGGQWRCGGVGAGGGGVCGGKEDGGCGV